MTRASELFSGGVVGVRGGLPNVGYRSGNYYDAALSGATSSAATGAANRTIVIPFLCRKAATFDRIALENTGTSDNGEKFRLGVIADNGGTPIGGDVLANPTEVTLDATAKDNAVTISLSLIAGQLVWLACSFNSQITCRLIAGAAGDINGWSGTTGSLNSDLTVGNLPYFDGGTYGALPDPFDLTLSGITGPAARIRLRAA